MIEVGHKSGILISAHKLRKCKRETPAKYTCDLLTVLFSNEELATCNLSGKKGKGKLQKRALDKQKVAAIKSEFYVLIVVICIVQQYFY